MGERIDYLAARAVGTVADAKAGDPRIVGNSDGSGPIARRADDAHDRGAVFVGGGVAKCIGSAGTRIVIQVEQVVRLEVSMVVIKTVVDHANFDSSAGVILPG